MYVSSSEKSKMKLNSENIEGIRENVKEDS